MIFAILRDTVVSLLRWPRYDRIANQLRYHSSHPEAAVTLVRGQNA